ncbi:MAG TPA: DsbA family oxidoreductase [Polyangiaceae bacterium]|jgi:predicted DsbA family dithiol-disulfide isomerase|nr:DsbA family oxidoreductase [Polyangiaceae bacterium]
MNIEIFSDLACPWCFIGKRRLERALTSASVNARLRFRAFQLQPGLPAEGALAESFFERKFGGKERVHALFERLTELGRREGIAFDFAKQERAPNTELAHRVVHFASVRQVGEATVEALFRGYFEQGVSLCELSEIVALLGRENVALDSAELCDRIAAGEGKEEVQNDLRLASAYGVGGVPLFIFDQRYAVEGAQPIEHFQRIIAKLRVEDSPQTRRSQPVLSEEARPNLQGL